MIKLKNLLILPILLSLLGLSSCNNKNDNKLVVAEVTHSLFYAPLYLSDELGYFKEEGLDVEIITTPGADKVMSSLLSKDATIGLMGPEATVYVYNNGQKDYAVNFAQLTQTDGSFLLGRDKEENFSYDELKGKTIIGGRKGGMPEMVLEYILKSKGYTITRNGEDKNADINIRTDVSFDVMTGVFVSGESDYVTAFEPNASQIEANKKGYILSSLGKELDMNIPYTCFSTLKSNLETKKDLINKFTKAIKKSLEYVNSHSYLEIAPLLKKKFSSSSNEEIQNVLKNYKSIEAWPKNTTFTKESFNKLIDIVKLAGELEKEIVVPYDKLVTHEFN